MEYKIEVIPSAQKDMDNLEKRFFGQIKDKINSLKFIPHPNGSLKLTAEEGYRVRSGDYRVIYRIDDKKKVIYIYRIKHRKESYR
ncbi:MAG: type II toxin-antitoxin system RelE/ParE family toxin [Candidatus Omnitrophota bacterium]